jgi:hypothetical protein
MIYSLFCRYANLKWSITKIIATSFYKINCLEVQKTFFWKSKLQSSSLSGFISPLLPYLICFSFRQENQNLKIDLYRNRQSGIQSSSSRNLGNILIIVFNMVGVKRNNIEMLKIRLPVRFSARFSCFNLDVQGLILIKLPPTLYLLCNSTLATRVYLYFRKFVEAKKRHSANR